MLQNAPVSWISGLWLKIEPLPTWFQPTVSGMRFHGMWLDTVSISANSGCGAVLASSRRLKAEKMYWSGIDA